MKISAAVKLVKRIAAADPYGWSSMHLACYVCQFCGGMGGNTTSTVVHSDDCIWHAAHELVRTAT